MNETITVNFEGIYSIGEFNESPEGEGLKPRMKHVGVYIWGFAYERGSNGGIGRQLDGSELFMEEKHVFIPYYVGQSSKLSVYGCFKRHRDPKKNKLYTVLSEDYLKTFFNDPAFPESIGKNANSNKEKREWFWNPKYENGPNYFKGKIIYHNNHLILKHLYDLDDLALPQKDAYPFPDLIKALLNVGRHPEASSIVAHGNDFFKKMYFCFTTDLDSRFSKTQWEGYTFYALNGKTVSQHTAFESINTEMKNINVIMHVSKEGKVLKKVNIFKDAINKKFEGYHK
jgi:hypothetical protein